MSHFSDLPQFLFAPPPGCPPWVAFRPAREADLRLLHQSCFSERPLAQFRDSFYRSIEAQRRGQRLHLLALEGGLPTGAGQVIAYTSSVEIADLAVAPTHRGKGLGTALITILSQIAHYAGYGGVEIYVMRENERALALYRRLGFVEDRELTLTGTASVLVLYKEVL